MKKLVTGLLASLLLANALPAFAGDRGHDRHWRGGWEGPRHHHRHHRHGGHSAPLAWGLAGLALGTVIYSVANPPVVAAPVMVVPAPRPPGRMAYYCESYQAHYPNVQYCPEGWRALPAY